MDSTTRTTSEVLNAAADHIEMYGHHKGSAFAKGTTRSAACTLGAIHATFATDQRPAKKAIIDYLAPACVVSWNDAPERTAAEVIETLRAVAVIEAARKEATQAVSA